MVIYRLPPEHTFRDAQKHVNLFSFFSRRGGQAKIVCHHYFSLDKCVWRFSFISTRPVSVGLCVKTIFEFETRRCVLSSLPWKSLSSSSDFLRVASCSLLLLLRVLFLCLLCETTLNQIRLNFIHRTTDWACDVFISRREWEIFLVDPHTIHMPGETLTAKCL